MPFYDMIAYGYTDYDVMIGFMPYCFYCLLAILSAHRELHCDRWCESLRYLVPSTSLPIYPVTPLTRLQCSRVRHATRRVGAPSL